MMIALAFAASATLALTGVPAHHVTVDHGASQVHVAYTPRVATRMKTVGAAAGTRMSSQQCRWTASLQVERAIRTPNAEAKLSKLLPATHEMEGSKPGACQTARKAVEREIAARTDRIEAHVRQVAEADRPALLAELETARTLALN